MLAKISANWAKVTRSILQRQTRWRSERLISPAAIDSGRAEKLASFLTSNVWFSLADLEEVRSWPLLFRSLLSILEIKRFSPSNATKQWHLNTTGHTFTRKQLIINRKLRPPSYFFNEAKDCRFPLIQQSFVGQHRQCLRAKWPTNKAPLLFFKNFLAWYLKEGNTREAWEVTFWFKNICYTKQQQI